jgi:tripartite-type tricarboxylate transporter receptor subunit TctC
MARLAAQRLEQRLGVPVVVENRSGANGAIGTGFVAQAAPDGYTLLGSDSTHPMAPFVMTDAPYDPQRDFVALARTAQAPVVMVITPRRPQRDARAVATAMRETPDDWPIAVASLGASGTLASIAFSRATGTRSELVLYRGAAPALTDVVAGNVPVMFSPVGSVLPLLRSGQLEPLMMCAGTRSALVPDVPTSAELGFEGLAFYSWYGVWAPRALPANLAERLNAILTAAMQESAMRERIVGLGFEPVSESLAEAARFIAEDTARNAELLRLARFRQ